jgi:hypothetical protein
MPGQLPVHEKPRVNLTACAKGLCLYGEHKQMAITLGHIEVKEFVLC